MPATARRSAKRIAWSKSAMPERRGLRAARAGADGAPAAGAVALSRLSAAWKIAVRLPAVLGRPAFLCTAKKLPIG